jgi:pectinesterase
MNKNLIMTFLFLFGYNYFVIESQSLKYDIVVAQDGTGNYRTVQEAVNAAKDNSSSTTIIFIKNGVYKEKVFISSAKENLRLIGENVEKIRIVYNDYAKKRHNIPQN